MILFSVGQSLQFEYSVLSLEKIERMVTMLIFIIQFLDIFLFCKTTV